MDHKKKIKITEIVSVTVLVIAMILVAFWGGTQLYKSRQWDPLGDYPLQIVNSNTQLDDEGIDDNNTLNITTEFYWDQNINSTGIKCVKDEILEPVDITGTLTWVSNKPPGRIIDVGKGSNTRGPGCIQYQFSNPIPDVIREEMEEMKAEGLQESVWHLTGTEVPFRKFEDGDIEEGESRTWLTTNFTVIHRNKP